MYCPQCRSEYVEGVTECAECHVPLVEELPPIPEDEVEYRPFVIVQTYHARHEAELGKSLLEANGVEAHIETDDAGGPVPGLAFTQGVRLSVKNEDLDKAQDIFNESERGDLEVKEDDPEVQDTAEDDEAT